MDWSTVLRGIEDTLAGDLGRADKAARVALTAFATTLSEAIVPVVDPGTGAVVGTLDVESAERDAFTDSDRHTLQECAATLPGLFAGAGRCGPGR
jgi:GAF domain-containing protein